MRDHWTNLHQTWRSLRYLAWMAALACLLSSQPTQSQTVAPQEKHVNHYVLIFRATRPFTPEENKTRLSDIQQWVKHVNEMGITLDPRNLGETAIQFSGKMAR